jgi:hypothetical protein
VGVIFSPESNFNLIARQAAFSDNLRNETAAGLEIAFWELTAELSRQAQPYDVVFFPDGKLREDRTDVGQLRRYRTLLLPQCSYLTSRQADALRGYLADGGHLVALGPVGVNLPSEAREAIMAHAGTTICRTMDEAFVAALAGSAQVTLNRPADLGLHVQHVPGGVALHLVNYDYDRAADAVKAAEGVEIGIRLPHRYTSATLYVPGREPRAMELQTDGNVYTLWFDRLPVYSIVLLKDEALAIEQ